MPNLNLLHRFNKIMFMVCMLLFTVALGVFYFEVRSVKNFYKHDFFTYMEMHNYRLEKTKDFNKAKEFNAPLIGKSILVNHKNEISYEWIGANHSMLKKNSTWKKYLFGWLNKIYSDEEVDGNTKVLIDSNEEKDLLGADAAGGKVQSKPVIKKRQAAKTKKIPITPGMSKIVDEITTNRIARDLTSLRRQSQQRITHSQINRGGQIVQSHSPKGKVRGDYNVLLADLENTNEDDLNRQKRQETEVHPYYLAQSDKKQSQQSSDKEGSLQDGYDESVNSALEYQDDQPEPQETDTFDPTTNGEQQQWQVYKEAAPTQSPQQMQYAQQQRPAVPQQMQYAQQQRPAAPQQQMQYAQQQRPAVPQQQMQYTQQQRPAVPQQMQYAQQQRPAAPQQQMQYAQQQRPAVPQQMQYAQQQRPAVPQQMQYAQQVPQYQPRMQPRYDNSYMREHHAGRPVDKTAAGMMKTQRQDSQFVGMKNPRQSVRQNPRQSVGQQPRQQNIMPANDNPYKDIVQQPQPSQYQQPQPSQYQQPQPSAAASSAGNNMLMGTPVAQPPVNNSQDDFFANNDMNDDNNNAIVQEQDIEWGLVKDDDLAPPSPVNDADLMIPINPDDATSSLQFNQDMNHESNFNKEELLIHNNRIVQAAKKHNGKKFFHHDGMWIYLGSNLKLDQANYQMIGCLSDWELIKASILDSLDTLLLAILCFTLLLLAVYYVVHHYFVVPANVLLKYIQSKGQASTQEVTDLTEWRPWFNTISELFAQNDSMGKELNQYSSGIEVKVEERTKQIQEQNQQMQAMIKKMQSQLQRTILHEKMNSIAAMVNKLAHELKNPLNFVINFATVSGEMMGQLQQEILASKAKKIGNAPKEELVAMTTNVAKNMEHLISNGQRLVSIINNLLVYSHTNAGNKKEKLKIHDVLNGQLSVVVNKFKGMYGKEVSPNVVVEAGQGVAYILGSKILLERSFANIFNNCCQSLHKKYQKNLESPSHTRKEYAPGIKLTTQLDKDHVIIRIKDNGVGIAKEGMYKIFDPFYSIAQAKDNKLGLGLSYTYDVIVNKHRGMIDVNSELDEFCEFIIKIPMT